MKLPAVALTDRGMTRLETNVLVALLAIGLVIGATITIRTIASPVGEMEHATVQDGKPFQHERPEQTPMAVSVVAAATIAGPLEHSRHAGEDACATLPGMQEAPFDCSLPVYVPALDLAASHVKGRYQCADRANYQLVGGQTVEPGKRCVLKSVAAPLS